MFENNAFPGETIEVACECALGAEEAHAVGADRVEGDQHQVGFRCGCGERETKTKKDQTHAGDDFSNHDCKCKVQSIYPLLGSSSLVVISRSPSIASQKARCRLREAGPYLQIILTDHTFSDRALQKTSSASVPAGSVRREFEPTSLLPSRAGRSDWLPKADHPWYRRARPRPAHEVHGGGQIAELCPAGRAGIFPAVDDKHPAAKPGGVVEPDHRHDCRRARNLRFHPPRSENFSALFFDVAGRRPKT